MDLGSSDLLAAGTMPRRLFHYNAGFLRNRRLRRILTLAGHDLRLGWPGAGDAVVVWGKSRYAARGEAVAARAKVPLLRLEDAFLRSVQPGRLGDAPLGLLIDPIGVHFDARTPSRLEQILTKADLYNSNLIVRSEAGIARLKAYEISKYNIHDQNLAVPDPGFILVVDQTAGDASVRCSGASASVFAQMLALAKANHPGQRIVIKTHPETALGLRAGHFGGQTCDGVEVLTAAVSPWRLLDAAAAVYTVSSQLGFEAILAGHRPHVFGKPFYAGWGLTEDRFVVPRRTRVLTAAQLFAGAMILAPVWYDPCRDRLCSFETALDQLEAETRAWREDRRGHVALGMRLWKRGRLQAVFGRHKPLRFADDPASVLAEAGARGADLLVWAGKEPEGLAAPGVFAGHLRRVEDGFLRSRGLGADLIAPLSLVTDDLGIYYDPTRPSRLEALIAAGVPHGGEARARALMANLTANGVTKYNLGGAVLPDLPQGQRILVPGQVEDDASILKGGGAVRNNLALLQATRAANPKAVILYKPHPDVEAGLRQGSVATADLAGLADIILTGVDPAAALEAVDEVWTITSLLGFEALLRAKRVTCLGAPFYAGWGLTQDLGPVPHRRLHAPDGSPIPRPTLAALVHATLIAYPRYFDPVSRLPCPAEVVAERLATGSIPMPSRFNRLLAKAQGKLASHAGLWR